MIHIIDSHTTFIQIFVEH